MRSTPTKPIVVPDWLKTSPLACHEPDRTIFEPQRRIVFRNGVPSLLDCCGQAYPLARCAPLRLEHLRGVALWVTEGQTLTVFRMTAAGNEIAITDGRRRAIVRFPVDSEVRAAAESLAQFFNGQIVQESPPSKEAAPCR
jgi:hypothetical protein